MKDPSRIYRWMLLVASLVTIVFLVGAAVEENYLAQWKVIQRQYRKLLEAKATDARGQELLQRFKIERKQVSVPALGAVDRCVSCHNGIDDPRMTDVSLPHRVHPGHFLDKHPVDRFGCTVCHHGQGAAMTFREAKADDVFWDYPLLPPELTEATCAACHDPAKLPAGEAPLLVKGMTLYQEKSCGSCHKLGGRGGVLGPALDNEGAKTRHQLIMAKLKPPHTTWNWQFAHFRDPAAVVDGSLMRNPTVTREEAQALTVFMLSQWKRDVPESYLAPDKIEQKARALHPAPLSGEQVYQQYCTACHGSGTFSRWDKKFNRFVPAIRGVSLATTASNDYLRGNIEQGRPGTQMPAWGPHAGGLMPEEITAVIEYLRNGATVAAVSTNPLPAGDAQRGLALFLRNCNGCHGMNGRGGIAPEIGNPVFQQSASDAFIVTTIKNGRVGTAMPAFQRKEAPALSDQDIADVLGYLRTLQTPSTQKAVAQNMTPTTPAGGRP
jgi:cbb3-type cytochrome c oxidase subunit III